jgi:hypothetical protein
MPTFTKICEMFLCDSETKRISLFQNWFIGFYLVEFEQNGQDRAIYGNKTIPTLVKKMAHIKGFFRRNFLHISSIVQTVSGQLETIESYPPEILLSQLSFSHFVELIQLDSEIKRRFYEVQVIQSSWSVKALERAINTLLFERTGLSTDKREVIKSHKDNTPETAKDLLRSPVLLEFLGLQERKKISENQLETVVIDHL